MKLHYSTMAVKTRTRKRLGGFEADAFAGSPFLRNLATFVRGTVAWGKTHEDQQHPSILLVDKANPAGFTSLSPEVQARLEIVKKTAEATSVQSRGDFTASAGARRGTSVVDEDGHIDWTRVAIAPKEAEEDDRALVEGARLAVSCDSWLRRRPNSALRPCFKTESLRGVPFVAEWIAEGSDEEAYVALCICFTFLEKTLFDMHHDKAESGRCPYRETEMPRTTCSSPVARQNEDPGGVVDSVGASRDDVATAGRSVMILRDLIASPMVKAALPEQMSTVLRFLLLPLSFNIRNLVVSLDVVKIN